MRFGISYYPEFIDPSEWAADLRNMRRARFSVLRIAEFAWSAMEPREGAYDFTWLDRFVNLAAKMGFEIIMCTPTATPPAWLSTQYPDVFIEMRSGQRRCHGGRRDMDVDNEIYRYYSQQIATVLGQRYGNHPAVVGWQIDNEIFGGEAPLWGPECHTPASTFRFRQWLKKVHGDVATLNRRWGTRFWSQEYSDWGEVTTPRADRSTMGQVLDYQRYFTHSLVSFIRMQYDALKKVISPRQFVTHNSTGVFDRGIDHIEYARNLDCGAWDAYFGAAGRPHPEAFAALAHDLFRSAVHKPFMVLETGPVRPGDNPAFFAEMRARGADMIVMWHYRSHRANAEQSTEAFADNAGRPYENRVKYMHALVKRPELNRPLPRKMPRQKAALLLCHDCQRVYWSPDPYKAGNRPLPYLRVVIETYRALWRMGVPVDVVRPGDSLDGYKLLAMPSARILGRDDAKLIEQFVSAGGTLLGVAKTAHQDQWASYYNIPGEPMRRVLGLTVRRDRRAPENLSAVMTDGATFACLPHGDQVELEGAKVIATCSGGSWEGLPAALTNRCGKGETFYATVLSPGLIDELARQACGRAKIKTYELPSEEASAMPALDGSGLWVFNHGQQEIEFRGVKLPPGEFALIDN
jgi:beta-galactosidase